MNSKPEIKLIVSGINFQEGQLMPNWMLALFFIGSIVLSYVIGFYFERENIAPSLLENSSRLKFYREHSPSSLFYFHSTMITLFITSPLIVFHSFRRVFSADFSVAQASKRAFINSFLLSAIYIAALFAIFLYPLQGISGYPLTFARFFEFPYLPILGAGGTIFVSFASAQFFGAIKHIIHSKDSNGR